MAGFQCLSIFPLQILIGLNKQGVGGLFLFFWQLFWTQFYNLNLIMLLGAQNQNPPWEQE